MRYCLRNHPQIFTTKPPLTNSIMIDYQSQLVLNLNIIYNLIGDCLDHQKNPIGGRIV
jgi:hypothetical protein